jgi:hypothetical protein
MSSLYKMDNNYICIGLLVLVTIILIAVYFKVVKSKFGAPVTPSDNMTMGRRFGIGPCPPESAPDGGATGFKVVSQPKGQEQYFNSVQLDQCNSCMDKFSNYGGAVWSPSMGDQCLGSGDLGPSPVYGEPTATTFPCTTIFNCNSPGITAQ